MLIRCKAKRPTLGQIEKLKRYFVVPTIDYDLQVGAIYLVFGLRVVDGQWWADIATPPGILSPVPMCLFDVIETSVSKTWKITVEDESTAFIMPEMLMRPHFYEQLADREPEALEMFAGIQQALMSEIAETLDYGVMNEVIMG